MRYFMMLGLLFLIMSVFEESNSEYFDIDNPSYYELKIDEHDFTIPYQVDANVLAMTVDQELNSFLVGLENTSDSIMVINLEHELISAENNEFAILVNGLEVDYDIVSDADSSTLSFFVPDFTEEIEIIGTHVIPEFPFGMIIVFTIIVSSIVFLTKFKIPLFRL